MLPVAIEERLQGHLREVRRQHERDLADGLGRVVLPFALDPKYPNAATDLAWEFVFPAARISGDPRWGPPSRFHVHELAVQREVANAVRRAGVTKHVGPHGTHLRRTCSRMVMTSDSLYEGDRVQDRLVRHGVILALLGSVSGFAPMVVTNPRMGVAAHLGGVMSGLLLLGLGAVWLSVRLSPGLERFAVGLLLWATYGNWAITLVASITGAKEFAPLAGAGYGASALVENGTLVLITTVALSTLAGLALVLFGLRKHGA